MHYGHRKTDYFGIAIAIPQTLYSIDKIEYFPVSDEIFTPSINDIYERSTNQNILSRIVSLVTNEEQSEKDQISEILDNAKNRPNILMKITVTLQQQPQQQQQPDNDTSTPPSPNPNPKIALYNYHMPCAFRTPIVQTLHVNALKRLFSKCELPIIFATDFNLTPNSDGYKYLTENHLPPSHKAFFSEDYNLTLQSGHKQARYHEPAFTCHSNTKWGGYFQDTLDYIFINNKLKCISSDLLIHSTEKMPNKLSPSDHLPLMCLFDLRP
jgi:mRNA deadenylase 3'-5' endonuclease subunit Ccr4